ncbi:MAG: Swt1 family HEPN domain-containing protein [Bacilli bacterium]|nr:Swt1 family HEPN domain-containing protein [Bacilli bacterium]MDD4705675.1 Swt1 family HEPN domain-containing protein [Bacilli bacterium]
MKNDLYSFIFRGVLTEENLDKNGRMKYNPEAIYYSEEIAKKLNLNEIDEKYIQQSKSMITVFAAVTAFENATRDFAYSVLYDAFNTDWWENGIQKSIKEKALIRKEKESKLRYLSNRGSELLSYVDFEDLSKIMTSSDNWVYFEPYLNDQEWARKIFSDLGNSRNVIMHSGILDEFDITRIGVNIRDWLRQINV